MYINRHRDFLKTEQRGKHRAQLRNAHTLYKSLASRERIISLMILVFFVLVPVDAALEWEKKTISLVAGYTETEVNAEYPFQNLGTEPVTITQTKTTCGCTVVALDSATIPPGGRGKVRVTFIIGERYGEQKKRITITTNSVDAPRAELELNVTLPPGPTITPVIQRWTVGSPLESKTTTLTLAPGGPLKITGITTNNRLFELAHTIADDGQSITITMTPRTTERNHGISVTVQTSDEERKIEKTYRIFGTVSEPHAGRE